MKGQRLKSAKPKGVWSDVQEVPGANFQVTALSGIILRTHLLFPEGMYDNMADELPHMGSYSGLHI